MIARQIMIANRVCTLSWAVLTALASCTAAPPIVASSELLAGDWKGNVRLTDGSTTPRDDVILGPDDYTTETMYVSFSSTGVLMGVYWSSVGASGIIQSSMGGLSHVGATYNLEQRDVDPATGEPKTRTEKVTVTDLSCGPTTYSVTLDVQCIDELRGPRLEVHATYTAHLSLQEDGSLAWDSTVEETHSLDGSVEKEVKINAKGRLYWYEGLVVWQ